MKSSLHPNQSTIVLIDNNEALLGVLNRLLDRNDYSATTFSDGREALAYIIHHSNNIDLVITHLGMPLVGIEIIDQIRRAGIDIPIIVLSANRDPEVHESVVNRGIRVMSKPISSNEFLRYVKDALSKGNTN